MSSELKQELNKLIEDAFEYYCEDELENSYFNKVKEANVIIRTLPGTWKCLTWPKLSAISNCNTNVNQTNCSSMFNLILFHSMLK